MQICTIVCKNFEGGPAPPVVPIQTILEDKGGDWLVSIIIYLISISYNITPEKK